MALLTGMTPDGQEVPVQVDSSGRLVAEGLTGPEGPAGPTGPAGPAGPAGPTGPAGESQWNKNGADINYTAGRVLVGTSSALTTISDQPRVQVFVGDEGAASYIRGSANEFGPNIHLAKTRSTTPGVYSVLQSGDELGSIFFIGDDGSDLNQTGARISASVDGTPGANDMPGRLVFSTCPSGAAAPVERMRIANAGEMSSYTTGAYSLSLGTAASPGTVSALLVGVYNRTGMNAGGSESIRIWSNGNVQNINNSYTAVSDIKLKENVADAGSQWADLKALRVRNYNLKEGQTHRQIGLIAQEVEPISPGLVYETPDRDAEGNDLGTVTKSVNYSVLYMKAVKALQEAMERIEVLEQRLTDAGIA